MNTYQITVIWENGQASTQEVRAVSKKEAERLFLEALDPRVENYVELIHATKCE